MRLLISVTVAALLFSAIAAEQDMAKNQESRTFKGRITSGFELNYLLFLPEGYKSDREKRWPLMLFLHGAGERGTNLNKVAVHGPPKIVKNRPDFPFIVVSPLCPSGETWSRDQLLALLASIMKEHRVDETRVYLTGLSMGGYGTWDLGLMHPDRFAAIAPICGGGDILPILLPNQSRQARLKKLPVWVFHGAKDRAVPLAESERMVNALKQLGNEHVKLTVYPEAEHDSWTETYDNPQFYDWLLQHTLPKQSGSSSGKAKKE